jgi:hypothetical protein
MILGLLLNDRSYLETSLQYRLAFREFGTCLGIGCAFAPEDKSDDATILRKRSEELISQWAEYSSSRLTPEDLGPITKVMMATAITPGGEWSN